MVNCSTFPTDSHPSSLSQEATSPSNFCKIDKMRFAFSPSIPFCMLCSQEHLEGQVLSKKPAQGSMVDVYYNFFCFPIQPEHRWHHHWSESQSRRTLSHRLPTTGPRPIPPAHDICLQNINVDISPGCTWHDNVLVEHFDNFTSSRNLVVRLKLSSPFM